MKHEPSNNLHPFERRVETLQRARRDGRVEVAALAQEWGLTAETVRRDLTALEQQGLVRRVHGGAIPMERVAFEPNVSVRAESMREEKDRIARAALAQLPEEGAILLDAGTTTQRLAELLPPRQQLTVVTNSLAIALTLVARPGLTLLTLSGRVRHETLAQVGAWALRDLEDILVDVAFIGTNGISVERGLATPNPEEAAVKRAMIKSARRVVVLADHTKVGTHSFCRFGSLGDVDVLITDSGVDQEVAAELEAAGPQVIRA
jgi:DeoR family fructose operon transcriptional repressor